MTSAKENGILEKNILTGCMYVRTYVCICMYVHRYVHTYVCCKLLLQKGNLLASKDFLCTYVLSLCIRTYRQTCVHIHPLSHGKWKLWHKSCWQLCSFTITYIHTCIQTYIQTQSCICGHASVQTYVPYMYLLCTCIHTHTYIHYIHILYISAFIHIHTKVCTGWYKKNYRNVILYTCAEK